MSERVLKTDFGGTDLCFFDDTRSSRTLGDFLDSSKEVDPYGIYDFLCFESVLPPQTPIKGVQTLVPGEERHGIHSTSEYQTLSLAISDDSLATYVDRLESHIADYVRSRKGLQKTGLLLSGGIDSAIILSYLDPSIQTFTWAAWPESTDVRWSRVTRKAFGVTNETIISSDYEHDVAVYKKAVETLQMPLLFSAVVPYARLAEKAAECGIETCFSGQNADTLFMAYPAPKLTYRLSLLNRFLPFNPFFFLQRRKKYLFSTPDPIKLFAYFKSGGLFPGRWLRRLPKDYFEKKHALMQQYTAPPRSHAQRIILIEEFLTEARKSQIYQHEVPSVFGLNIDCPYYDRSFIEITLSLPQRLRRLESYNKVVFKELARRRGVPEDVITHKKKGLSYGAKFFIEKKRHIPIWDAMEQDDFLNTFVDVKAVRMEHQDNFFAFDQLQSLYWWGQFVVYPRGLKYSNA